MSLRSTPGPGGFGSPPVFGHTHSGVHLVPARTSPVPGMYSGPSTGTSHHALWPWLAVAVAALLVALILVRRARRRPDPPAR